jgi:hypothetical protein
VTISFSVNKTDCEKSQKIINNWQRWLTVLFFDIQKIALRFNALAKMH